MASRLGQVSDKSATEATVRAATRHEYRVQLPHARLRACLGEGDGLDRLAGVAARGRVALH